MAYQRQARDSNEQDGADAQALDCHRQVLEYEPCPRSHSCTGERWPGNPRGGASLVATPVSQYGDSNDVPVAGNGEKARIAHEMVTAASGTPELSGHFEQGTLAQHADAARTAVGARL